MSPGSVKDTWDARARAWEEYTATPEGRILTELTWRNLTKHLEPMAAAARKPLRILDAGGGTGELAIRLARQGYKVCLLDFSPEMLAVAWEKARHLELATYDNLTFVREAVENVCTTFLSEFFDVVACHTVIEYVIDPRRVLGELVRVLKVGGLFSITFINRHAQSLRLALAGHDLDEVLTALDSAQFEDTPFDVPGQSYSAEEITSALAEVGVEIEGQYGVRVFTNHLPSHLKDQALFDRLLNLETAVGERAPHKDIARYVHLLGRKADDHRRRSS